MGGRIIALLDRQVACMLLLVSALLADSSQIGSEGIRPSVRQAGRQSDRQSIDQSVSQSVTRVSQSVSHKIQAGSKGTCRKQGHADVSACPTI
jgi:hypothetical protein